MLCPLASLIYLSVWSVVDARPVASAQITATVKTAKTIAIIDSGMKRFSPSGGDGASMMNMAPFTPTQICSLLVAGDEECYRKEQCASSALERAFPRRRFL